MRTISATELLRLWERGSAQSPTQRALSLLTLACSDIAPEELAQLSIGQRDAYLLTLREQTFGPRLSSRVRCPACGEHLEINLNVADVRAEPAKKRADSFTIQIADCTVCFRLPNSLDLAALPPDADVAENSRRLLEHCLLTAHRHGEKISPAELPPEVVAALSEKMAEVDPQAMIQLALTCPQCRHDWQAGLDIGSFFWGEIHVWAVRLLREVHMLASAYGWREADILALNPLRRQAYLEMVRQ